MPTNWRYVVFNDLEDLIKIKKLSHSTSALTLLAYAVEPAIQRIYYPIASDDKCIVQGLGIDLHLC